VSRSRATCSRHDRAQPVGGHPHARWRRPCHHDHDLDTRHAGDQRVFYAGLEGRRLRFFRPSAASRFESASPSSGRWPSRSRRSCRPASSSYPPFGIAIKRPSSRASSVSRTAVDHRPPAARGSDFRRRAPSRPPEQWLTTLKSQVATQARLPSANPGYERFRQRRSRRRCSPAPRGVRLTRARRSSTAGGSCSSRTDGSFLLIGC